MSFIAKNPLTMPEVESSPSVPQDGTRGIFAGGDGWYDIDSNSNTRKIATDEDIDSLADTCQKKFATVQITGGLDNWIRETIEDGDGNIIGFRYGQEVTVNDASITPCSKVDLQISSEQMVVFYEKSLAFVAENEDGVITIYCVGGIPKNDYIVQAVVTEVATETAKIVGNVVGLPNPQPDWEQKDRTKADYIKNKPDMAVFSNALTETASGRDMIALTNVSPLQKNAKLNVSRVNLLSSPFAELDFLENGKNYTFSVKLKEDIELPSDYYYIFQGETAEGITTDYTLWGDNRELTYSFTISEEYSLFRIVYDSRLTPDMFEYCQLEEGIVATAPTPYIEDMNNVSFYKYGKNLLNYQDVEQHTLWKIVSGVADGTMVRWGSKLELPAGSYSVRCNIAKTETGGIYLYTQLKNKNGELKDFKNIVVNGAIYTKTYNIEDGDILYVYAASSGETYNSTVDILLYSKMQVELGSNFTEYEPYKEPVEVLDINNINVYPNATLKSDIKGVNISTQYNKDINEVIADLMAAIISLGGNV